MFSGPVAGYTGSTISFATSIKAACEDWGEWLEALERFLGKLKALSARVTFDEAEAGRAVTYTYVVTERTPQGTHVRRWKQTEGPEEVETALVV